MRDDFVSEPVERVVEIQEILQALPVRPGENVISDLLLRIELVELQSPIQEFLAELAEADQYDGTAMILRVLPIVFKESALLPKHARRVFLNGKDANSAVLDHQRLPGAALQIHSPVLEPVFVADEKGGVFRVAAEQNIAIRLLEVVKALRANDLAAAFRLDAFFIVFGPVDRRAPLSGADKQIVDPVAKADEELRNGACREQRGRPAGDLHENVRRGIVKIERVHEHAVEERVPHALACQEKAGRAKDKGDQKQNALEDQFQHKTPPNSRLRHVCGWRGSGLVNIIL